MSDRPRMYDWSDTCDYMEELEAEIDRLRAALKKIAGPDPESTLDEPDLDGEVVVKLRAIASAALSNGDQ